MNLAILRKLLFIMMIVISCMSNVNRADFNVALLTFGYLLWDQKNPNHKVRLCYLIVFSWAIDLVWIIKWGSYWSEVAFKDHWSAGINTFSMIINIINLILKVPLHSIISL